MTEPARNPASTDPIGSIGSVCRGRVGTAAPPPGARQPRRSAGACRIVPVDEPDRRERGGRQRAGEHQPPAIAVVEPQGSLPVRGAGLGAGPREGENARNPEPRTQTGPATLTRGGVAAEAERGLRRGPRLVADDLDRDAVDLGQAGADERHPRRAVAPAAVRHRREVRAVGLDERPRRAARARPRLAPPARR